MRRRRAPVAAAPAPLWLLDAGNTRLKWGLWRPSVASPAAAPHFSRRGVLALAALRRSDAPLSRLLRSLPADCRILGCNVAGAALEARVRSAAAKAGLPAPRFVRTQRSAGGVRNGYPDPWRLGADRWVALIGAHAAWPRRAQCLVGIGSALTIDLLAADGRHRGGCIAPGPQMMIESLLRGTAGIRRRALLGSEATISAALESAARHGTSTRGRGGARGRGDAGGPDRGPDRSDTLFAHATHEALLAGARHACAALIDRAARQARALLGARVQIVLAGGAADTIAPLLQIPCHRDDDLVLRGLIVLGRAGRPIA